MTTGADDLRKAVQEAEAAVAAVKDPELKRAAFEKILERLLAGDQPLAKAAPSAKERHAAPSGSPRRARSGPRARVEELIDGGFFKKPRTLAAVKAELANQGHHIARTTLSPTLLSLIRARRLRRQKGEEGAWEYSNL